MSRNFPAKTCVALCSCLFSVVVAGASRAFEGGEEAIGKSANQAPSDGPWQEELKERQNDLRSAAFGVMHTAPSRSFRRLTWATPAVRRKRVFEFLRISGDQQKLLEDLDRVTRETLNLSVLRDIQFLDSLKRRPANLDRRLMESEARRREIAAHVDKIVQLGILDPYRQNRIEPRAIKRGPEPNLATRASKRGTERSFAKDQLTNSAASASATGNSRVVR